jgi:ribosomal protein L40E
MARKKVGHIELQWRCPNCDGINRGREKTCASCGAPQPEDVKFEQTTRQELLKDEKLIARAEAGADIHCPYCDARNPGNAETCTQCGGDLAEGARRQAGQVIGAFQSGPAVQVPCPACGAENSETARNCAECGAPMGRPEAEETSEKQVQPDAKAKRRKVPIVLIILAVVVCAVLGLFMFLSSRTTATRGVVQNVQWERSVVIEAFMPVEYDAWHDQIPEGSELGSCQEKVRSVQSEPAPNAKEVCGTPYTVDSGGGFAEVVQDCEYEIYEDYCNYTVMEWAVADTVVLTGNDFSPMWPDPSLTQDQRLGEDRNETYTIVFAADGKTYDFSTDDFSQYQQFDIGSSWNLEVNTFGAVVSVEP